MEHETSGITHVKTAREYAISDAVNFKPFNPNDLPDFFAGVMFGQRRTGKTTLMRDLVHSQRKRFDKVFVFSLTAHIYKDSDYDFVPPTNFVYGLDEDLLEDMMTSREREVIKRTENGTMKDIDKWLFIFDDIIGDKKVRQSQPLNNLFVQGRHFAIYALLLCQHATGIPPVIRRNLDVAFCFRPNSQDTREIICKEYMSLEHWKVGQEILKNITSEDHVAVAIMLKDPSVKKYEDQVFKYQCEVDSKGVPKHWNFKIGHNTQYQRTIKNAKVDKSRVMGEVLNIKVIVQPTRQSLT